MTKSYCCHVSFFYSFSEKVVLTPQSSRKSLKNSLKMSSKSIRMNDFSTGNQLERFFRFVVSNLHTICYIRFCQIWSKKNGNFDEITLFLYFFFKNIWFLMKSYCKHFLFFSEKIKNWVLQFISAQNVPENDEFSMKTIYKPTTFCGEGFLGLDSI